MKILKKIFMGVLLVPAFYVMAESFIVPKKKSAASSSAKEEVCMEMSYVFKQFPSTFKVSAELQEVMLEVLDAFVVGDKKNILPTAEKEQAKILLKKLKNLREEMEMLQGSLVDCLTSIKEAQQLKK